MMPNSAALLLLNTRIPSCLLKGVVVSTGDLTACDLSIEAGRIAEILILPTMRENPRRNQNIPVIDCDQGIVFPGFVECHTHLDKGHIWSRQPNPDGTFMGALTSVGGDRENHWTAQDVRTRMAFSLRTAYAHGTVAIRTHIDSLGPSIARSWPVFAELRERWKDRIALQATPLFAIDEAVNSTHMDAVIDAVKRYGSGIMGAVTYMSLHLEKGLDILFRIALEHNWDLDFHVDEATDPSARSLERIAAAAIRHGFKGKILCGHCCALALQSPEEEARIISLVKQAGIEVVSLPMCNMYLQDRVAGRTARWRGVTSFHELAQAGVPVMVSSDNTRDPFYAHGDLDGLEVLREATRILQLDHPVGQWPRVITSTPADVMRLTGSGRIGIGLSADLVLFKARNWTELLARPQSDRVVLRAGKRIRRTMPDYRSLDHLEGMRP